MMRSCCIDEHWGVIGGGAGSILHHGWKCNIFLYMRILSIIHFITTPRAFHDVGNKKLKYLYIGVICCLNLGVPLMRNNSLGGTDHCCISMLGVVVLLVR